MFKQVRRSLGERLVESSVPRPICIRRIHSQNPIRGAAAQVQQVSAPLSGIQSYQTKPSAQNKSRKADNLWLASNSSRISSEKTKAKSVDRGEEKSTQEDLLKSATSLNSPHHWDKKSISKLYEPPAEDEIPARLEKRSKPSKPTKVYDWRENPFKYLEEGLMLAVKMESVNIKRKGGAKNIRVRLSARWASHSHVAIGDGTTKVLDPF